jgi:hypothetical protein
MLLPSGLDRQERAHIPIERKPKISVVYVNYATYHSVELKCRRAPTPAISSALATKKIAGIGVGAICTPHCTTITYCRTVARGSDRGTKNLKFKMSVVYVSFSVEISTYSTSTSLNT